MDREIDELLNMLLREEERKKQAAPAPAVSETANKMAQEIARNVEDTYQPPPEPPKREAPPEHPPVVVPEPVSHFTEEPSQNPAVRMHDRLDESNLPKPDEERKPTQIRPARKNKPKRRRKPKAVPIEPEESLEEGAQAPKHLASAAPSQPVEKPKPLAPLENPAPAEEDARQAMVRSRAEMIREQLRRQAQEEASPESKTEIEPPKEVPEAPEEPEEREEKRGFFSFFRGKDRDEDEDEDEDLEDEEEEEEEEDEPEEKRGFFSFFRGKSRDEEEDEPEEIPAKIAEPEAPHPEAEPKLHHLAEPEAPAKKPGLKGRFRQRRQREPEAEADEAEDGYAGGETPPESVFETKEAPVPEPVLEREEPEPEPEPDEQEVQNALAYFSRDIDRKRAKKEREAPEEEPEEEPEEPEAPEEPEPLSENERKAQEALHLSSEHKPDGEKERRENFVRTWREVMDESADELAEMRAEPLPEAEGGETVHFWKRNMYFAVGLLCFLFAIVGLVTVIRACAGWVKNFMGASSLREELRDALYPSVVVDMPAFETAEEIPSECALSAAVMDILMFDDLSVYPDNVGTLSIPAEEVRARAQAMFGAEYASEGVLYAAGEMFFYDEEGGCYNVPDSPVIFSYAPEVEDIQRDGETYTVTVRCQSDVAEWQRRSENFQGAAEKMMRATLTKTGERYELVKFENVS